MVAHENRVECAKRANSRLIHQLHYRTRNIIAAHAIGSRRTENCWGRHGQDTELRHEGTALEVEAETRNIEE